MTLYIKNYSSYRDDIQSVDVKKELKQKYKIDTRRQDKFIHLAVYGGQLLKEKVEIDEDDELYVTSGVGNIDIVQKTNTYMYEENQTLKLFDFINLLGNTTSYYVASTLGIKGKSIFQISDNFTYINTLLSLYSSINSSRNNAILCSIDLVSTPDEIMKRVLAVKEDCNLVSSVNYQKYSLEKSNAIAKLDFDIISYSYNEIKEILLKNDKKVFISSRCKELKFEKDSVYFETMASYVINNAIKNKENLLYIDYFNNRYKMLKIESLK